MTDWIDANKELPITWNRQYWVHSYSKEFGSHVDAALWFPVEQVFGKDQWSFFAKEWVTHWMPIPMPIIPNRPEGYRDENEISTPDKDSKC